jgi:20S proteasome alpha/beta subunit
VTIIVSVKINDGIVMASDSASILGNNQINENSDKIVNLVRGLPIGVMITGNAGIGSESIATLLKDLRRRLTDGDWKIDRDRYTMKEIADRVREFLFGEKATTVGEVWMQLRICGYSAGRPLPEIWDLKILGKACDQPTIARGEDGFGVNWDGEYEALNRLILGTPISFGDAAKKAGISSTPEQRSSFTSEVYEHMVATTMPIQDAIDLARYLVETVAGFVRFSLRMQPKVVGGPIEIAVITKHEGFKWVQRKHFYSADLNPCIS